MKKIEYGKKLLTPFIVILLFFALNLNVFASSSVTLNFYNQPLLVLSSNGDITDSTVVTEGTYNNHHYTKFYFPAGTTYSKVVTTGCESFNLYSDTTYNYYLQTESSLADYNLVVDLLLYDSQNNILKTYNLVDGVFPNNASSGVGSYVVNSHSGTVYIETINNVASYAVLIAIGDDNNSYYCSNLFLYDMTFTATGPLYGGVITPENLDDLGGSLEDWDEITDSLPQIDRAEIQEIMDFDFSGFTAGMQFIRDMFDDVMACFNFSSVLAFSLTMGIACLLLGRKASGT